MTGWRWRLSAPLPPCISAAMTAKPSRWKTPNAWRCGTASGPRSRNKAASLKGSDKVQGRRLRRLSALVPEIARLGRWLLGALAGLFREAAAGKVVVLGSRLVLQSAPQRVGHGLLGVCFAVLLVLGHVQTSRLSRQPAA